MLGNAGSLFGTTVITSALGFAFWALAARLFNPHAVGFGSAAISAMTVLGTIGMFGLNTLLIGELPHRESKAALVSAALVTAGIGSLLLGLGFALVAPVFSRNFAGISSPTHLALFVSGVTIIGVTMVFDDATIGLLRGRLQLWRNFLWASLKLSLLPVAAFFLHDKFGTAIVAAAVAGAMLSMCVLAIQFLITRQPVFHRPDWGVLRRLRGLTFIHNWLNLAIVLPSLSLPVLVTIAVGAYENAAFYVAWMVTNFLRFVPVALSKVLFAVAAGDVQALRPKLRFSLRMSMLIGIPGMVVLCLAAPVILGFFGASYVKTGVLSLVLLSLGYLPSITKVHYIAVCRATGQLKHAAVVLTCTACLILVVAFCGGRMGGLTGLNIALLAACTFEGLVTAPRVIRTATARKPGRHRGQRSRTSADKYPLASPAYLQRPEGSVNGHSYSSRPSPDLTREQGHSPNGANGGRGRADASRPDAGRSNGYQSDPLQSGSGTVSDPSYSVPQQPYSGLARSVDLARQGDERHGYENAGGVWAQTTSGYEPRPANGSVNGRSDSSSRPSPDHTHEQGHGPNGANGGRGRPDASQPDAGRSNGYRSDTLRPDPLRSGSGPVSDPSYPYAQQPYSGPARSVDAAPRGGRHGYENPGGIWVQANPSHDPRPANGDWSLGQFGRNGVRDDIRTTRLYLPDELPRFWGMQDYSSAHLRPNMWPRATPVHPAIADYAQDFGPDPPMDLLSPVTTTTIYVANPQLVILSFHGDAACGG
jgi:O-antigen/teichoic acid export membrane protein